MALNSEQAIQRATNKLLDIVAREQESQSLYIGKLIQERDAALLEAQKAKKEADIYRDQVQRYRAEADTVKQQLAQTYARYPLTLVPVHDAGMLVIFFSEVLCLNLQVGIDIPYRIYCK
jgi:hypothetical protein